MTLLHQAAQKAVEAKQREAFEHWYSDAGRWPKSVARGEDGHYLLAQTNSSYEAWRAAAAALQHQEEPSTAVIPPAPHECETEDEKTAFSFGYWQGLHAARKGMEVPRESELLALIERYAAEREEIAVEAHSFPGDSWKNKQPAADETLAKIKRAVAAASPSTTRQQEVRPVFDELIAFEETCEVKPTFADAVSIALAAKKRTRQQEAGSGPDWKEYALHYEKALRHIAETAFASKDWKYAREALAAAPSTPEKAGGVSDGVDVLRDAIESKAREVYDCWKDQKGWVPWVEGGNSTRQDDARRIAATSPSPIPHPLPAQANDGGEQP